MKISILNKKSGVLRTFRDTPSSKEDAKTMVYDNCRKFDPDEWDFILKIGKNCFEYNFEENWWVKRGL